MRTLSKKQKATVAGLALLGLSGTAGVAYAYWTTTGSGSGSAANQAAADTLSLSASFAANTLAPGKSVPVSFSATNAGSSVLRVTTLTVSSITTSVGTCDPAWFSVASSSIAENTSVPNGTTALPTGTTLTFNDSGTNQDACKGATVTLNLTSV